MKIFITTLALALGLAFGPSGIAHANANLPLPAVNYVGAPCNAVTTQGFVIIKKVLPDGRYRVARFSPKHPGNGWELPNRRDDIPAKCMKFVPSFPVPLGG